MRSIVMLALLGCRLCLAQTAADECKPSTLNIPSAQYPCVYPDHRATFRVVAPDAQKVQVRIGQAGTAHGWLTWRRCLNDFAPRLFK